MKKLIKTFKALSDTNRIRILKMLEERSLCVCEITKVLELATSTVSKHLYLLKEAEFITDSKDGKWVNYELTKKVNNEYIANLLPLIKKWLPEDKVIKNDKLKVKNVNRNVLCNL